jgi:16S rRNA (guanine527-N7)-methyltransferase
MNSSFSPFSKEVEERLKIYNDLLSLWQQKLNLVGQSTLENIWHRHFIDSAQLYPLLPKEKKGKVVYDIGAGAGFPGMILSLMGRKDMVLCESSKKKCAFLEEVKIKTNANVIIDNIRAEALPVKSAIAITARAVSSLDALIRMSSPLLDEKGMCIFPKGINWKKELLFAQKRFHIDYKLVKSVTSKDSNIIIINRVEKKNVHKK